MIDRLRSSGILTTGAVERALAAVPRHRFIEGVGIDEAYADVAVIVKTDEFGRAISSASQPTMVTAMLEMCQLQPGHRVLEIGTGTGYNAALVSHIVGETGRVVSVELDAELAASARTRLAELGYGAVEVVTGDGANGHPGGAPYECVIVTTGAHDVAPAWVDQLVPGGRLVVPVVNTKGRGLVHALVKGAAGLRELATIPCGFLTMRTP